MSNNSLAVVHEGWLTKSPPSKPILRARWRRRWFVLRHSGELPEQYFLEYYTDKDCRKLKGKIDLDQCEQVDAGLQFEHRKQKYQHMFDVKTPKRTYFLAAESEEEMNKWVECVCHVCRLIAYKEDEDVEYATEEEVGGAAPAGRVDAVAEEAESPPVSPSSTTSGPYIPISECISGKPVSCPNGLEHLNNLLRQGGLGRPTAAAQYAPFSSRRRARNAVDVSPFFLQRTPLLPTKATSGGPRSDEFYDSPRQLNPPAPTSPPADGECGVFADDEWTAPVPSVNWETFPSGSDGADAARRTPSDDADGDIGSWSVVRKFGRLTVVDSKSFVPASIVARRNRTLPHKPAPPRPPKPFHLLLDAPSHNYLNLENVAARPTRPKQPPREADPVPPSPGDSVASGRSAESPPASPPHAEVVIADETYDFPRSHRRPGEGGGGGGGRHCYTNAAPARVNGDVFRYDFHEDGEPPVPRGVGADGDEEPTSPRSEGSSSLASSTTAAVYSNLPSPQPGGEGVSTPPAVDRGLKPGRKLSDSASPGPVGPGHVLPPNVDRKLKPHRKYLDTQPDTVCTLQLAPPPDGSRSLRRNRAAPSPTPPGSGVAALRNGQRNSSSDDDHRHSPVNDDVHQDNPARSLQTSQNKRFDEIQYLDLDLDSDMAGTPSSSVTQIPKSPERSEQPTVYKTVDFLKTQAFNKTRQTVEEERKQCPAS